LLKENGEMEAIKADVLNARVLCVDETPIKCTQRMNADGQGMEEAKGTTFNICERTYSTEDTTLLTVNSHKDLAGVDADGILTQFVGNLMHDHDKKYNKYTACTQCECNIHVIRYLKGFMQLTHHIWLTLMLELLMGMFRYKQEDIGKGIGCMDEQVLQAYSEEYDRIIQLGKGEVLTLSEKCPTRKGESNLVERLGEYKASHLRFAYDYQVPFTNNEAERSFRWSKTHQKVSGCHRSYDGAAIMARLMSFTLTLRKRHKLGMEGLRDIFNRKPVLASK
jgi:transposase